VNWEVTFICASITGLCSLLLIMRANRFQSRLNMEQRLMMMELEIRQRREAEKLKHEQRQFVGIGDDGEMIFEDKEKSDATAQEAQ
jgi:ABC-type uncharacterized transport system ATPase subunit